MFSCGLLLIYFTYLSQNIRRIARIILYSFEKRRGNEPKFGISNAKRHVHYNKYISLICHHISGEKLDIFLYRREIDLRMRIRNDYFRQNYRLFIPMIKKPDILVHVKITMQSKILKKWKKLNNTCLRVKTTLIMTNKDFFQTCPF